MSEKNNGAGRDSESPHQQLRLLSCNLDSTAQNKSGLKKEKERERGGVSWRESRLYLNRPLYVERHFSPIVMHGFACHDTARANDTDVFDDPRYTAYVPSTTSQSSSASFGISESVAIQITARNDVRVK